RSARLKGKPRRGSAQSEQLPVCLQDLYTSCDSETLRVPRRRHRWTKESMVTAVAFAVGASFLASCVEFVEAFTIILAVGITRSWKSSLLGAAAAAVLLAVIIAGFGLKWMRKAILRFAGIKGLHDEEEIFAEETEALRNYGRAQAFDWVGFTVSLKSTLLEGLEVAFIVITFGLNSGDMSLPALGAAGAFVVVAITGFAVRKPLEQVPENTMKFVVGVMLS